MISHILHMPGVGWVDDVRVEPLCKQLPGGHLSIRIWSARHRLTQGPAAVINVAFTVVVKQTMRSEQTAGYPAQAAEHRETMGKVFPDLVGVGH